jgi:hypothetical protein
MLPKKPRQSPRKPLDPLAFFLAFAPEDASWWGEWCEAHPEQPEAALRRWGEKTWSPIDCMAPADLARLDRPRRHVAARVSPLPIAVALGPVVPSPIDWTPSASPTPHRERAYRDEQLAQRRLAALAAACAREAFLAEGRYDAGIEKDVAAIGADLWRDAHCWFDAGVLWLRPRGHLYTQRIKVVGMLRGRGRPRTVDDCVARLKTLFTERPGQKEAERELAARYPDESYSHGTVAAAINKGWGPSPRRRRQSKKSGD